MNREVIELEETMKEVSGQLVTHKDECQHLNTSPTAGPRDGRLYVLCLDCGKILPVSEL
jgi:hypothetical protein